MHLTMFLFPLFSGFPTSLSTKALSLLRATNQILVSLNIYFIKGIDTLILTNFRSNRSYFRQN